jgi:hypothetical protein
MKFAFLRGITLLIYYSSWHTLNSRWFGLVQTLAVAIREIMVACGLMSKSWVPEQHEVNNEGGRRFFEDIELLPPPPPGIPPL